MVEIDVYGSIKAQFTATDIIFFDNMEIRGALDVENALYFSDWDTNSFKMYDALTDTTLGSIIGVLKVEINGTDGRIPIYANS